MADEITKVPYPEHEDRCQAIAKHGQCLNFSMSASKFCKAHGGNRATNVAEAESKRNYQLTKWRARLQRHSSSSSIKSLRDEIGILRMILEEKLNQCTDENSLMLASGPLSELVMKITQVVKSCHALEGSMKQLLDKQAILQFAGVVITIITTHVKDEETVGLIAQEIMSAFDELGEEDEEL